MENKKVEFILGFSVTLILSPFFIVGFASAFEKYGLAIASTIIFAILIFLAKVFKLKYFALGGISVFIFLLITVGSCVYTFRID